MYFSISKKKREKEEPDRLLFFGCGSLEWLADFYNRYFGSDYMSKQSFFGILMIQTEDGTCLTAQDEEPEDIFFDRLERSKEVGRNLFLEEWKKEVDEAYFLDQIGKIIDTKKDEERFLFFFKKKPQPKYIPKLGFHIYQTYIDAYNEYFSPESECRYYFFQNITIRTKEDEYFCPIGEDTNAMFIDRLKRSKEVGRNLFLEEWKEKEPLPEGALI